MPRIEFKWHLITASFYSPMDSQLKQVLLNLVTQTGIGFVLTPTVTTEKCALFYSIAL